MKKRIIITFALASTLALAGCSGGSSGQENVGEQTQIDNKEQGNDQDEKNKEDVVEMKVKESKGEKKDIEKVTYEVLAKDEIHIAGAKRYAWDVVVTGKASEEKLKELSKKIVEEAKKDKPFNAIVIGLYDYKEYIGSGYALGKVEYAPEGDWGKANTVKTGDYKKMEYKYSLKEKDWSKQLTKDEVKIYKAWKDLYEESSTVDELPDEEEISKEIANKFSKTSEEVDSIMMKQSIWSSNDNK